MNNNNWGSQPNRPPYGGLPQMPPLPQGYQQQQYGNGNAMAYMGNQQYQSNNQLVPQPGHQMAQMQPMPHYGQHQQQLQQQTQHHPAHNFHAHQQQQQHPHYENGAYGHHATAPSPQYIIQPDYSRPQPRPTYSQHAPMPSPRQMQQPVPSPGQMQQPMPSPRQMQQPVPSPGQMQQPMPSPRQMQQPVPSPGQMQQPMPSPRQMQQPIPSPGQMQQPVPSQRLQPTSQSHPPPPRHQSASKPLPPPPQPRPPIQQSRPHVPSPQPQHHNLQSIDPNQLRQSHSHMPSPQIQQRASSSIDPRQIQQAQSPVPSSQLQQRASISINPSQIHQSQSPAPSPQLQYRGPTNINPTHIHQSQSPAPSPQLQHHAPQSIDPSRLQHGQSPAQSPQPQARAHISVDPSQLQQKQAYAPSPQLQHRTPGSIDPSQLQPKPSPVIPAHPLRPSSEAIDPNQLHRPQSSHTSPAQLQRPGSDAIDPSQLHQTQPPHISPAQLQRQGSNAIDPSKLHQGQPHGGIDPTQLMLNTTAPARKSMPSATHTKMSPVISHTQSPSQHFDTPAVLTCVANDCFRTAHAAVQDVATSLDPAGMDEYYKLIATGLGCLEAALALNKMPPRSEANVRLRYATILCEETDNLTEAEVTLTKGIAVCDKNRLTDLKYCMQFQLVKVLFRRNRKAALVALDKNISEATTYKAVDWVYAFRFLRASFHLQSGNPADTHAMDNLRHIASLATHRGDYAIAVVTSLLEGIVHLKSRKDDSIVRVQTCIAQAARYQLDPSVHIPQIEVLTLLLDLACSLQQKTPGVAMQKLKALQSRMDELVQASDWDALRDELLLPLKRQPNSSTTVTGDTNTIVRPGGEHNFIVMSFVTKVHAFVLAYVLSGLALLYHGSKNEKLMEYWTEALNMLARKSDLVRPAAHSLPMAIEQAKWRAEVGCYIHTLIALISATRTQWARVYDCIQKIEALRPKPADGRLGLLILYVTGVFYQGTGDLDRAYRIFSDPRFDIIDPNNSANGNAPSMPPEVSLLAALNRIWILQEPSRRDVEETTELLDKVQPYCINHPDIDVRTAFNLAAAAIETNPPRSIQTVKRHISTGLKFAQGANNTQLLGVALNLMRSCLFEGVVGDQAVKSAKAGKAQAWKAGNLLWMSVGEGMLAQTEEMQGQHEQAERLRASGTEHANKAFVKPEGV